MGHEEQYMESQKQDIGKIWLLVPALAASCWGRLLIYRAAGWACGFRASALGQGLCQHRPYFHPY